MTTYFDDILIDDATEDFSADPEWVGVSNRTTFVDCVVRPRHDFGFQSSSYAGGKPGEMGGIIWRTEASQPQTAAYYGDPAVGVLTLDQDLTASGRVSLTRASSDSGVLIGWFNSETPGRAGIPED